MKKLLYILLLISGFSSAQIVNIPDANFKAALLSASTTNFVAAGSSGYQVVDTNSDGEIQVSEALQITILQFQSTGITDFTGIENFANLQTFGCYNGVVNDFHLNGLQQLSTINITYNTGSINAFSFSNLPELNNFSFTYSNITSLTLNNLTSVTDVNIWGNSALSTLNLVGLTALDKVSAFSCAVSNLSITSSPLLRELDLNSSALTSISTAGFPVLKILRLSNNLLTSSAGIVNNNSIEEINIQGNQISNLVLPTSLPTLKYLYCGGNGFSTINLSGYPNLRILAVNNNSISTINFSNNPLLQQLLIFSNPISILDVSNLSVLNSIACSGNLMTELDFSNNPLLTSLSYFDNPNLTYINLKSGTVNAINYSTSNYYNLPNLQHICIDEGDTYTYSVVAVTPTVPISSYCNFTPGGNFNTITGAMIFDANNNGCDALDLPQPSIKININDGTTQGSTFTNNSGNYNFYTESGSFEITPSVENPSWFTFSPVSATIPFANDNNNITTQNFCITANGVHPDLEIVIAPIVPARPGFDAVYQIVYKNKGNQTLSQLYGVNFFFNQNLMDFVSATTLPSTVGSGALSWSYANLLPFESRSIYVTLNINTPTDVNPVNIGDVLQFTTSVLPMAGDESTSDNTFLYNQTVIGSYDPNDITCMEGNVVPPSEIGEYLHYVVNFENTGTAEAENIVVKTEIDEVDFDINSLQMINTSHNCYAKVTGNVVEFIFQNIMLDTGGHGNVLLKIRSKSNLVTGDTVSKQANIFFDYNAPIQTNMETTTFQSLNNNDFDKDDSISIYPNPTSSIININSNNIIKSIQLYDVQGRLLQTKLINEIVSSIDISDKSNGIYFLKITSDKGVKVEKFMKN